MAVNNICGFWKPHFVPGAEIKAGYQATTKTINTGIVTGKNIRATP